MLETTSKQGEVQGDFEMGVGERLRETAGFAFLESSAAESWGNATNSSQEAS